jgi:hypothetical protein
MLPLGSQRLWPEYGSVFAFEDRPDWHSHPLNRAPQVSGSMIFWTVESGSGLPLELIPKFKSEALPFQARTETHGES